MINFNEQQYLNLLQESVDKAEDTQKRSDRTGVGTYSLFGKTLEFDLTENKIPLLTTKKVSFKQILEETFWMYRLGNPDLSYMDENNNKIWKEWTIYNDKYPKGTIGRIYGAVLRDPECDQIKYVLDLLKTSPKSRRAVFSTFDPKAVALEHLSFEENVEQGRGVLNSCHGVMNQLYINDDNELEMYTYTRSNDIFLGCPYNIVCYSTLAHLFARHLGVKATKLIYQVGDAHLYSNHVEQAKEQLSRQPYKCPSIVIDKDIKKFDDWKDIKQISLINYQHHAFIKAPVAI